MNRMSRREFSLRAAALGAAGLMPSLAWSAAPGVITRAIPGSGERVPAVGLGTARVFDVGDDPARRAGLAAVLRELVAGGGSIIDTATSYGSSEAVVGDLVAQAGLRKRVFIATKLEAPDEDELRGSLRGCARSPWTCSAPQRARPEAGAGAVPRLEVGRPRPLRRHQLDLRARLRCGRGGARARAARFPRDRLLARRPRSREAPAAAGARPAPRS